MIFFKLSIVINRQLSYDILIFMIYRKIYHEKERRGKKFSVEYVALEDVNLGSCSDVSVCIFIVLSLASF